MSQKIFKGVVKNKVGDKSIKVASEKSYQHPLYKRTISHKKFFIVHDEENSAKVGDVVKFKYSRPLSRIKNYILIKNNK